MGCSERRGGPAKQQQGTSRLPTPEERGQGLPKGLQGRGLKEQAECESLSRFDPGSPVWLCSPSWSDWSDGNFPESHPVTQVPLEQVPTPTGMSQRFSQPGDPGWFHKHRGGSTTVEAEASMSSAHRGRSTSAVVIISPVWKFSPLMDEASEVLAPLPCLCLLFVSPPEFSSSKLSTNSPDFGGLAQGFLQGRKIP